MQPEVKAIELAQSLLAVTLSAEASVAAGDWETAGHLLRRREQILTQLEREKDIKPARDLLTEVQRAEASLLSLMERTTREAAAEIGKINAFRSRRNPFANSARTGTLFERYG